MKKVKLSVLDLAMATDGDTTSVALDNATRLAQCADELGFRRFWVAEHHNMDTVASTNPAVLIAHLASQTSRIRLGSGGVMLPNHAPLVIAEQFALLEALHPDRIDLGIGRAPGSDQHTAAALRRTPDNRDAQDFPMNLIDLMGLLGDERADEGMWNHLSATPAATSYPDVYLLGSSNFSAELSGMLGLPFVFANHFDTGGTLQAVKIYRESFKPSVVLSEPYTMVTASVIVSETREEAEWESGPGRIRKYGMRTGRRGPLVSPEDAANHPDLAAAKAMPTNSIIGTPEDVAAGLEALVKATQASELMISTSTFSIENRLKTLRLLAEIWDKDEATKEENALPRKRHWRN
ncbi:MAG TPA: LLM class flavin-dependent oxidoreductase [Dehalococcoidia bacterium]|nr:LLM class flavin-dependent oxidoreductase [Dehalococcoidia bacterium]